MVTPTQLYWITFPLRHNSAHALTHLQEKTCNRDREYTHTVYCCAPLLTFSLGKKGGGATVLRNHSHVLGEADSVFLNFFFQYTFQVTHRFPLRSFHQTQRTNEQRNTLVKPSFSFVLFPSLFSKTWRSLGELLHLIRLNYGLEKQPNNLVSLTTEQKRVYLVSSLTGTLSGFVFDSYYWLLVSWVVLLCSMKEFNE